MALCTGCGNEVPDPACCPVCKAGRGTRRTPRPKVAASRCACPKCNEALDQQDWEGTATLTCPVCRGSFFPDRGLEAVLDRLRATCDPVSVESALKDFRDRFTRELPDNVRYKKCPVCDTVMLRRNYGNVSGVIVEYCGEHGTWVDENSFAELASFICRGGDLVAGKADAVRARSRTLRPDPGGAGGGGSLLSRFLGGGE